MIITADRQPAAFRITSSKLEPASICFRLLGTLHLCSSIKIKKNTERFPAALHFNCNLTYKRRVLEFESYNFVIRLVVFCDRLSACDLSVGGSACVTRNGGRAGGRRSGHRAYT